MKTTLLFLNIFLSGIIFSQAFNIEWQKSLGGTDYDYASSVKQTSDGGYISVGQTSSWDGDITLNHGGREIWVQKVNSSGVLQWQKSFGGSQDDIGECIITTSDGGYLISGMTSSNDGDVSGNHTIASGYWDAWLIKISSTGTLQWQKCYGSTGSEDARYVIQTTDGGYIFTGESEVNNGDVTGNHGGFDIWCVKVNSSGVLQWQKSFGGTGSDRGWEIKATNDGGYIICGTTVSFNGDVTGNHGYYDAWILKLSSTGTLQWQKCYGGLGVEEAWGITLTSDGGYIFVGYSNSTNGDVTLNNGSNDVWVVKINNTGVLEWQKSFGGSAADVGHCIIATSDGGYILSARSGSNDINVSGNNGNDDAWVLKLSSTGILQWQKCVGSYGNDAGLDIQTTTDGGLILACGVGGNGGDASGFHGGLSDAWLVKLSEINCNNFYITSNNYYTTSVNFGDNVSSMPIIVNSNLPLNYEWTLNSNTIYNGVNYSGATTNQLTVLGANYSQDDNLNNIICYVTDNNGCSDTAYFEIDVCDDITQQPFTITRNLNSNATFTVAHADPTATYQWRTDFGAGFQNISNAGQYSGANTNTLTVYNLSIANNNQYFFCIIGSHCNNLTHSDSVVLLINPSNSLDENYKSKFYISPNPITSSFTINEIKSITNVTSIHLKDINGKVVKELESDNLSYNIQDLKSGVYLIEIITNDFSEIIRIIKQ